MRRLPRLVNAGLFSMLTPAATDKRPENEVPGVTIEPLVVGNGHRATDVHCGSKRVAERACATNQTTDGCKQAGR